MLDPFGRGRSARFIDANGDSRPDLFVANDPTRGDGLPSPNRFLTNQLEGGLRYAPEYGLQLETSLQGSNNASVGDLDKDGWQDLLLTTPQGLRVYHNEQGRSFTEVAASVGLGQSPRDVTLADVNADGWLDVIEVEPSKLSVFTNSNGKFSSVFSTALQYGHSVAAGDVNSDNRPDVYVMRGRDAAGANAPDQVYLNDGASFTQMSSIPSTSQCEADSVAPLDYDGNGLTDFLVLNGGGEEGSLAGPVELIAFFRGSTPTDPKPPSTACTKTGTSNSETISGTSVADVICGVGGNDTIKGLAGNDILLGGDGNDTLLGGTGDDTLDGGAGTDTASYSASLTAVTASLATNSATGEGSDTFVGVENLLGSSKTDTLTGSESNNKLTGGGGSDTVLGGLGSDQVIGSGGADTLKGEDGDDTVNSKDGVNGNDSLDGGAGTDTKVTDATEKSIVWFP